MTEITLESLTKAELKRYQKLFAVTPKGDVARFVWDSKKLIPLVAPDHPGTLIEDAYVQVPTFALEHLAPLYAELEEIGIGQIIYD